MFKSALGLLIVVPLILTLGCASEDSSPLADDDGFHRGSIGSGRYLYFASGTCYAGGATTSSPSFTISAYDLERGGAPELIFDYNAASPGDSPVGIADYDRDHILVAVENASGRRLDLVRKDGSDYSTYLTNSTALSAQIRGIALLPDHSILVSKSTSIEKFSAGKARILQGANPFVSTPAGACATSTTMITALTTTPNGKILYTHSAASPNNKFGLISSTGYAAAGDCLQAQASPTATSLPTSILMHSSGRILAAYGSATAASNLIRSHTLDLATNAIGAPVNAFTDFSVINGPSAMIEDIKTGHVYVASGAATFNTIEKLSLDVSTGVLTKATSTPLIPSSVLTRCVSAMSVVVVQ